MWTATSFQLETQKRLQLEPVAAVGDPPAHDADGDGSEQAPQERQGKIRNQAEPNEHGPKDFALHSYIVAPTAGRSGL